MHAFVQRYPRVRDDITTIDTEYHFRYWDTGVAIGPVLNALPRLAHLEIELNGFPPSVDVGADFGVEFHYAIRSLKTLRGLKRFGLEGYGLCPFHNDVAVKRFERIREDVRYCVTRGKDSGGRLQRPRPEGAEEPSVGERYSVRIPHQCT